MFYIHVVKQSDSFDISKLSFYRTNLASIAFHFLEFEGERIPHLVKVRNFKKPKDSEEVEVAKQQQEEEDHESMDNYVLKKLFKKTGLFYRGLLIMFRLHDIIQGRL